MKLKNFIKGGNEIAILSSLSDFLNSKLLTVRSKANEYLKEQFCNQLGLQLDCVANEHSEITITFTDPSAVQKLKSDMKIDTNEALTPILLNKRPDLMEISLIVS